MPITFEATGNFKRTENFLKRLSNADYIKALNGIAQEGVSRLKAATPKDSGETAASWSYSVKKTRGGYTISWDNSHVEKGVPIAIILQYGHGTRNGGYVAGRDYINPAMRPVFDSMAEQAWKVVTSS